MHEQNHKREMIHQVKLVHHYSIVLIIAEIHYKV